MKTIKSNIALLTACLFAVSFTGGALAQNDMKTVKKQNEKKVSSKIEDDADFLVTAADGGMFEVQAAQLAENNASSADVKQFARTMIEDHTNANNELKNLARQKNILIPTVLSDKHQKKYNDLAGKKGDEFDKAYMDMMVKDHKKDVDDFKKESDKGKDPDIKSWATDKVQLLKHHLEMAQNIYDSLKSTSRR